MMLKLCNTISHATLRERVRAYPWMQARVSRMREREEELGLSGLPDVSEEFLIDERRKILIGLMVSGTITTEQRHEFDVINGIRVALMVPETLRRRESHS